MVELVEVEDESFETKQPGPSDNEDEYYTDTGSALFFSPSCIAQNTNLSPQTLKSPAMMKTPPFQMRPSQTGSSP